MAPHMVQQWQVRVLLRVAKLLWLYLLGKALNDAEWGDVLFSLTWYMMKSASQEDSCISGITPLIPEISNLVCSRRHPQEISHEPDL